MARQHRQIFRKTLAKIKGHYQHILSLLLVMLSISIVYREDLEILLNEALQSEAVSHVLLIPFLAAFLLYLKRDMVKASLTLEQTRKKRRTQYTDEAVGVALCLIAFILYWYGSHTFYPLEFHLSSLPIFIMGITLILFNLKVLITLLFPILFLLFLVPLPMQIMFTLGGAMANFNTQAAYTLLETLGLPVTLTSSYGPPILTLTTSTGEPIPFAIDLPCSGIYSLVAFAMVAAFLVLISSPSIPKKIALFALGFIIFEFLNVTRITAILCIGYRFGEEVAMLVFHTVAGLLLIFTGTVMTALVAQKALKIQLLPNTTRQPPCSQCEPSSKALRNFCTSCGRFLKTLPTRVSQKYWAKLFLLVLGSFLVTLTVHAPTFAIAQDSIEITSGWQESANIFPSSMTDRQDVNYTLIFLYRDTSYEEIAHQDASLMYGYFPPRSDGLKPVVYLDLGVANSISNLHNWEVCLITWRTIHGRPPAVSVQDSRDIQLLEDASIIARFLVFKDEEGTHLRPNSTQVTLYWYERATFNTGVTVEQKYVRISLIIWTNSTEYQQLEDQLLTFGQHIASYWKPLKSQSIVSLGVPAQQLLLALSLGFITFAEAAEYAKGLRERRNNQEIFNRYASTEEKLVLQTIQELAEDKKEMDTREINQALKRRTGVPMDPDTLLRTLNHLEEYGFIKKAIISIRSQPNLVWKRVLPGIYKP